jgi:hypothetical protein
MTGARFSRIVIIQSLPTGDSPTGRHLRDAIEATAESLRDIPVEFIDARSANDFWAALDRVRETVESATDYPVLHLECHGISDGTGLSLADGTPIHWLELKTPLAKLNHATRCNLFITLAACHGAKLMEALDTQARAPCWGLLGPSGEVSPADLRGSYSAFFLELLRSTNTDAALSSLRESPERRARYFLFTAEDMFQAVFRLYRVTCSTEAQMTEKAEQFERIAKKHWPLDGKGSWIRSELYRAERKILERFFERFFFVDHFPENRLRFQDAYSALAP